MCAGIHQMFWVHLLTFLSSCLNEFEFPLVVCTCPSSLSEPGTSQYNFWGCGSNGLSLKWLKVKSRLFKFRFFYIKHKLQLLLPISEPCQICKQNLVFATHLCSDLVLINSILCSVEDTTVAENSWKLSKSFFFFSVAFWRNSQYSTLLVWVLDIFGQI